MDLSIIMPAYNEKDRIKRALEEYASTFRKAEILVMVEGEDGTIGVVRDLAKTYKNIRPEYSATRLGKGKAIKNGFTLAKGNLIGFVDSDGSVSAQEFKRLVEAVESSDGVIASRRGKGSNITENRPVSQRFGSMGLNLISRLMFGLPFRDTQCGAKLVKKEALMSIVDDLVVSGFAFDINLLYSLKKKGYDIKEIGVTWKHMRGSKFNFSVLYWKMIPTIAFSLLRLRFKSKN